MVPVTFVVSAQPIGCANAVAQRHHKMTSQGTAHGRFQRAIERRNLRGAEIAARELGELSLGDALAFCLLLADVDPPRFDRLSRGRTAYPSWPGKYVR
jgi:hypothetical protein